MTDTYQKPYRKENSQYIHDLAILHPAVLPEMTVNVRADEQFLSTLLTGPAIIPQIMLRLAFLTENQEDSMIFNEMFFDVNIGEVFCENLNTKLQLCSRFGIVPQEGITKNKVVWKLLEKEPKGLGDYRTIGIELGVDTVLEIEVLSYGIKDPGIFSDPHAILNIGAKMIRVADGMVLWEDVIYAKSRIEMDTIDFVDTVYADVTILKKEIEKVIDIVSEECLVRLGIDTHNTYILGKGYSEGKKEKIDLPKKLNQLNNMRYDSLITNRDYKEKKRELVDRAMGRKTGYKKKRKVPPVKEQKRVIIKGGEKTKSGLPPLPRRD
ncbi:MAG: hypothetical protein SCALA701_35440 [Candidatus Scalindua sp.]|nr:hypothetical protein [Planctomycetota bacterium]GJQ60743.1 MAG: hypothetical protein SCALA701_35440 [Candidatus Scalindua sp.]